MKQLELWGYLVCFCGHMKDDHHFPESLDIPIQNTYCKYCMWNPTSHFHEFKTNNLWYLENLYDQKRIEI
jgi:hypothetical protein